MRGIAITFGMSLLLFSGCAEKQTPGPPVSLRSFVLHDVQGFHGGHALWASDDRTAILQTVGDPPKRGSGLWEKRYKVELTDEQWAEVERLVGAHHFLTLKIPNRTAVPDEAHPIITVVTKAGVTATASKLASDKHPDFDPLLDYLLGLCRANGQVIHEGAFDWEWQPDGFERPW